MAEIDRGAHAERHVLRLVYEAVELKQHLGREHARFPVEKLRRVGVELLFPVFYHGVDVALPRQHGVSGLVKLEKGLPYGQDVPVDEDPSFAGVEKADDFRRRPPESLSRPASRGADELLAENVFRRDFDSGGVCDLVDRRRKSAHGVRLSQKPPGLPADARVLTPVKPPVVRFRHGFSFANACRRGSPEAPLPLRA